MSEPVAQSSNYDVTVTTVRKRSKDAGGRAVGHSRGCRFSTRGRARSTAPGERKQSAVHRGREVSGRTRQRSASRYGRITVSTRHTLAKWRISSTAKERRSRYRRRASRAISRPSLFR